MAKLKIDFSMIRELTDDIFERLGSTAGLFIEDLILDQSFCVVRLNTGSVGMSMNYALIYDGREVMRANAVKLKKLIESDPLLQIELWENTESLTPLLRGALQVALLSALSKSLFKSGSGHFSSIQNGLGIGQVTQPGDTVSVIGFGGYLESALKDPNVHRVYVADLFIGKQHTQKRLEELRAQFPAKELIGSDGGKNEEILRDSQVACITASALPNGTLSSLLEHGRGCRAVVLQGKSGHVYPEALFRAGVTHVTTYDVKPESWCSLSNWCRDNPSGDFSAFIDKTLSERVAYFR